jgi:hypothetical protein
MNECVEPIVGKILAGWRYDISGLAPEMRGDYELHFAACERCRSRQKLHRIIDISLIALASASAAVFLLAFAVIRYLEPRHAFWLEVGALAGFALSAVIWLILQRRWRSSMRRNSARATCMTGCRRKSASACPRKYG